MNMPQKIVVGNWKMQLPFDDAYLWVKQNHDKLIEMADSVDAQIVLCPSFDALSAIAHLLADGPVALGAQDCSAFRFGAYTGQVSATSLAQIGCHYCIIGHSERRQYNHETDQEIADKMERLFKQGITPIACIGETKQAYEDKKTEEALTAQLKPLFARIKTLPYSQMPIIIAYEPIWSIGTGIIPEQNYLETIFHWLNQQCTAHLPKKQPYALLYGGSVNDENIQVIKQTPGLSGLLIGSASIDFQKLNNIVYLYV